MARYDRRTLLAGAAASLLPLGARAAEGLPPLATPQPLRLDYDLSWIGIPVGRHRIEVTPEGPSGDFTVSVDVEITIELLFVDVIRFAHTSLSVWRGGLLESFESTTEDDGEFYDVRGASNGDGLEILMWNRDGAAPDTSGPESARTAAPADIMTNNDVWLVPVPGRRPILNAKNGEVVDVAVSGPATDTVRRDGELQRVERYDVSSVIADGSLFYDGPLFVAGWFTRRGRTVDYRLAQA